MLEQETDHEEGTLSRVNIELFIIHPTLTPEKITAALGLEPKFVHRVGHQRMTPKGTLLSGLYPDTRWRHVRQFTVSDQWFSNFVEELLEYLEPHRQFLHDLRITGGSATLIVRWLGDDYFGDELSTDTLAKLVRLDLDLGMECHTVPQSI